MQKRSVTFMQLEKNRVKAKKKFQYFYASHRERLFFYLLTNAFVL